MNPVFTCNAKCHLCGLFDTCQFEWRRLLDELYKPDTLTPSKG